MIIYSPDHVVLPRKTKADKKYALNLNVYRNTHYQILNQAKKEYTQIMGEQLAGLKLPDKPDFIFQLHRKTRRIVDSSNVYAVVEKFFCDALIHHGCIEDDNDYYIGVRLYFPAIYGADHNGVTINVL